MRATRMVLEKPLPESPRRVIASIIHILSSLEIETFLLKFSSVAVAFNVSEQYRFFSCFLAADICAAIVLVSSPLLGEFSSFGLIDCKGMNMSILSMIGPDIFD